MTTVLTTNERKVLNAYGHGADIPAIVKRFQMTRREVTRIVVDIAKTSRPNARQIADTAQTADAGTEATRTTFTVPPKFSPRELETLQHAAAGHNGPAIAVLMDISVWTVHEHLAHAYQKLGAERRGDAIATARALGIIAAAAEPRPRISAPVKPLTARELEVLAPYCDRHTIAEIAGRVGASISTVRTHIMHIHRKLDAATRTEAIATARRLGLLDVPSTKAEPR